MYPLGHWAFQLSGTAISLRAYLVGPYNALSLLQAIPLFVMGYVMFDALSSCTSIFRGDWKVSLNSELAISPHG